MKIKQASFKNITFSVISESLEAGRITLTHKYINSDAHSLEDLGKKPRIFKFEALLDGRDYLENYQKLLLAIEDKQEAGELIHPVLGSVLVRLQDATFNRNTLEAGLIRFSISFYAEFKKTADFTKPAINLNNPIEAARTANNNSFTDAMDVIAAPHKAVIEVLNFVDNLNGKINQVENIATNTANEIHRLSLSVTKLLSTKDRLLEGFDGVFKSIASDTESVEALIRTKLDITNTSNEEQVAAREFYARNLALAKVSAIDKMNFKSKDEADALGEQIIEDLTFLETTDDYAVYTAFHNLRINVSLYLAGLEISRLETYVFNESLPAPQALYKIAGSIGGLEDFIKINKIKHPMFCPKKLVYYGRG